MFEKDIPKQNALLSLVEMRGWLLQLRLATVIAIPWMLMTLVLDWKEANHPAQSPPESKLCYFQMPSTTVLDHGLSIRSANLEMDPKMGNLQRHVTLELGRTTVNQRAAFVLGSMRENLRVLLKRVLGLEAANLQGHSRRGLEIEQTLKQMIRQTV